MNGRGVSIHCRKTETFQSVRQTLRSHRKVGREYMCSQGEFPCAWWCRRRVPNAQEKLSQCDHQQQTRFGKKEIDRVRVRDMGVLVLVDLLQEVVEIEEEVIGVQVEIGDLGKVDNLTRWRQFHRSDGTSICPLKFARIHGWIIGRRVSGVREMRSTIRGMLQDSPLDILYQSPYRGFERLDYSRSELTSIGYLPLT